MTHIALLEDDPLSLQQLINGLNALQDKIGTVIIQPFTTGESLLTSIANAQYYDLLILDIHLEGISGMGVAEQILEKLTTDDQPDIIFISAYIDYLPQAYALNAVQFILKPLTMPVFSAAIDRWLHHYRQRHEDFTFSYYGNIRHIPVNTIVYLASDSRMIRLQTSDNQQHTFYGQLRDQLATLGNLGFIKCHKSFIVNMAYIKRLEANIIRLKPLSNHEPITIPVSYRQKQTVLAAYAHYLYYGH